MCPLWHLGFFADCLASLCFLAFLAHCDALHPLVGASWQRMSSLSPAPSFMPAPGAPYLSAPCNNCLGLASVTLCQRTQRKARMEEPGQPEKAVREAGWELG